MHRGTFVGLVTFCLGLLLVGTMPIAKADDMLMFYWPFDESSGTSVGSSSGYPGTLYGSPTWISGGGLSFDGIDDYARTNSALSGSMGVSNQAYTLSASVRVNDSNESGNIIHISNGANGIGWCIAMLHIQNGYFRAIGWDGGPVTAVDTVPAVLGQWYSIANTWSPETQTLDLYVNGTRVASTPMATYQAAGVPVYIFAGLNGGSCSESQGWFKGDIKDVRIYSRAITQEEAEENSNQSLGLITVALSPLDGATGVATSSDLVMEFSESVTVGTGTVAVHQWSDGALVEAVDVESGQLTGSGTDTITVNLASDLAFGREYYVLVSETAFAGLASSTFPGMVNDTDWNFTTEAAPVYLAEVETGGVTDVTQTSASLHATVISTGGQDLVPYGFHISLTPDDPGSYDFEASDVSMSQGVGTYEMGGEMFECGTTYYYRAFGENNAGTAYGNEESFSTLACDGDEDEEVYVERRSVVFGSRVGAGFWNLSSYSPDRLVSLIEMVRLRIQQMLADSSSETPLLLPRDLEFGMEGEDVRSLQTLLIKQGYVIPAGATGLFVGQTAAALTRYQMDQGVAPAVGYFGSTTRAHMKATGLGGLWW